MKKSVIKLCVFFLFQYICIIEIKAQNPPFCQAYFSYEIDTNGLVHFYNASFGGTSCSWSFGSSQNNPTITFPSYGIYNVCISISGNGCSSTFCKDVEYKSCRANFSALDTFGTGVVHTKNLAYPSNSNFLWKVYNNNGQFLMNSSDYQPVFDLTNEVGYVNICLILQNDSCVDSSCTEVEISSCNGFIDFYAFDSSSNGILNNKIYIENYSETSQNAIFQWNIFGDNFSANSSKRTPEFIVPDYGNYTICLQVNDGACSDSICWDYNYQIQSIFDFIKLKKFKVYPNPNQGEFNIRTNEQMKKVVVYQLTGTKVFEQQVNGLDAQLKLPNVASGLYILEVETESGIGRSRIQIQ